MAQIRFSMEDDQTDHLGDSDDVRTAWKNPLEFKESKTAMSQVNRYMTLANMRMGDSDTVAKHSSDMRTIIRQIEQAGKEKNLMGAVRTFIAT